MKGPKDAFVETVRTNTSLVRRHLRTPQLRLREITVGRRSITNVTVVWIGDITSEELVERMEQMLLFTLGLRELTPIARTQTLLTPMLLRLSFFSRLKLLQSFL